MNRFVEKAMLRFVTVHDTIHQRTNGRVGHRLPGMPPNLLLHSTGAKSGQPRTNTLTYANAGNDYLIVASNGGANRYPAWYHNLGAHPDIEVTIGGRRFPATATVVGPDDADYPRLWDIVNANNANRYRDYQTKTSRPIKVIVLSPR